MLLAAAVVLYALNLRTLIASLPPLLLDPEEAVAMAVCLRVAAGGSVAGVGESALRALTKLDQVMPSRLRSQVAAIHDATTTLTPGQTDELVAPDASDEPAVAERAPHRLCHAREHAVAGRVAESVVHALEVVQIDREVAGRRIGHALT